MSEQVVYMIADNGELWFAEECCVWSDEASAKEAAYLKNDDQDELTWTVVRLAVTAPAQPAEELRELLCPVHAKLDEHDHLEPFDNCVACIRAERDELKSLLMRISTDCAQTAIEDPLKYAEGWVCMSTSVRDEVGWRASEYSKLAALQREGKE